MDGWVCFVMGVAGAGKSTVGRALSEKLGCQFVEGDIHHPASNVTKMAAGVPLTDEDREPWLVALHDIAFKWSKSGTSGVITCSALKRKYRDILVCGICNDKRDAASATLVGEIPTSYHTLSNYIFVVLHGPEEVIWSRLQERKGHFMPPALLQSQLDTLELPSQDEKFVMCSLEMTVPDIIQHITSHFPFSTVQ